MAGKITEIDLYETFLFNQFGISLGFYSNLNEARCNNKIYC